MTVMKYYTTKNGKTYFMKQDIRRAMADAYNEKSPATGGGIFWWHDDDLQTCNDYAESRLGKAFSYDNDGWKFYFTSREEAEKVVEDILSFCRKTGYEHEVRKRQEKIDYLTERLEHGGGSFKEEDRAEWEKRLAKAQAELDALKAQE